MKKFTILLVFFVALFVTQLSAQGYKSAIGVRSLSTSISGLQVSSYNVSGKLFINPRNAVEGVVGFYSVLGYTSLNVAAFYQIHTSITKVEGLNWYIGGGPGIILASGSLGIQIIGNLGLDYKFKEIPLNVSIDFTPSLSISPSPIQFFPVGFGFAARYVLN